MKKYLRICVILTTICRLLYSITIVRDAKYDRIKNITSSECRRFKGRLVSTTSGDCRCTKKEPTITSRNKSEAKCKKNKDLDCKELFWDTSIFPSTSSCHLEGIEAIFLWDAKKMESNKLIGSWLNMTSETINYFPVERVSTGISIGFKGDDIPQWQGQLMKLQLKCTEKCYFKKIEGEIIYPLDSAMFIAEDTSVAPTTTTTTTTAFVATVVTNEKNKSSTTTVYVSPGVPGETNTSSSPTTTTTAATAATTYVSTVVTDEKNTSPPTTTTAATTYLPPVVTDENNTSPPPTTSSTTATATTFRSPVVPGERKGGSSKLAITVSVIVIPTILILIIILILFLLRHRLCTKKKAKDDVMKLADVHATLERTQSPVYATVNNPASDYQTIPSISDSSVHMEPNGGIYYSSLESPGATSNTSSAYTPLNDFNSSPYSALSPTDSDASINPSKRNSSWDNTPINTKHRNRQQEDVPVYHELVSGHVTGNANPIPRGDSVNIPVYSELEKTGNIPDAVYSELGESGNIPDAVYSELEKSGNIPDAVYFELGESGNVPEAVYSELGESGNVPELS